ncbi:response regulator transcription factor [Paenibacillus piri]|nr:response regulator [Paenibacillus piri]
MYRVLIVDDEPWVLKGIRSTFKWEELGFQVVAETTDSLEAYEIIIRDKPDVVMTDIRMPECSGIDLMKRCRERGIQSEFVIISGASDFHYAQESIRLGCFDYLLKPLQFEEADALLERLLRHLNRGGHQQELDLLESLQHADAAAIRQLLRSRGITAERYQAVYMSGREGEQLAEASEWFGGMEHIVIHADPNKRIVILGCTDSRYPLLAASYEQAAPQTKEGLHIGVSEVSASCDYIPKLIGEAHTAMHDSFVYPAGGTFLQSKEMPAAVRKTVQAVCTAIHQRSDEQVGALLGGLPELFRAERAGMKDVVFLWNQIVSTINHTYNGGSVHSNEELSFMDYGALVHKFSNLEELCSCLSHFIRTEAGAAAPEPDPFVNENFKELLEYVNDHFEQELHLRELSAKFFINYTYCCDLFQKTAKVTFTDYVTRLRLNKAGRLLKDSDMSISEICREAGYKDYHYFNKVFKKWYGVTPSHYRKSQTAPYYGEGRG